MANKVNFSIPVYLRLVGNYFYIVSHFTVGNCFDRMKYCLDIHTRTRTHTHTHTHTHIYIFVKVFKYKYKYFKKVQIQILYYSMYLNTNTFGKYFKYIC